MQPPRYDDIKHLRDAMQNRAQAADGASKAGFRKMSGECSGCVKITYKLAEIRYLFEPKMRRQIRIKIRYP